jgi:hypothetical protein
MDAATAINVLVLSFFWWCGCSDASLSVESCVYVLMFMC